MESKLFICTHINNVKKPFWFLGFIFLVLFLLLPQKTFATFNFNIATPSSTSITSGSQELNFTLNINNLPSESFFRVALQKQSGGSYYGYLFNNNGEWAAIQPLSGDCSIYYRVTDTTTSSINLKFKLGDDSSLDNGTYVLKGHRFTKTCSSYTESTNSQNVMVSLPTPTPTPSPTPTPTKTPSPSPTQALTPTPTPTLTAIPIATNLLVNFDGEEASIESEILGTSSAEPSASVKTLKPEIKTLSASENILQKVFIILGFLIIITSAGIFIRQK